ncbi:MAG: hypothetical protein U1E72_03645 [Burkholderiaceae bacterium]
MAAQNRRPPRLPTDDEITQAREASRQLARLLPAGGDDAAAAAPALRLVTDDNQHEMIAILPGALRLLVDMLTQLGQGRGDAAVAAERRTHHAGSADYLNVSRPYVVKLIEEEKPFVRKAAPPRGLRRPAALRRAATRPATRRAG